MDIWHGSNKLKCPLITITPHYVDSYRYVHLSSSIYFVDSPWLLWINPKYWAIMDIPSRHFIHNNNPKYYWFTLFIYIYNPTFSHMGMDQYLLIPFLMGWTSIYQLFWGSLGARVLTNSHIILYIMDHPITIVPYWRTHPAPRPNDSEVRKLLREAELKRSPTWAAWMQLGRLAPYTYTYTLYISIYMYMYMYILVCMLVYECICVYVEILVS